MSLSKFPVRILYSRGNLYAFYEGLRDEDGEKVGTVNSMLLGVWLENLYNGWRDRKEREEEKKKASELPSNERKS